jgi:hypothetical protein
MGRETPVLLDLKPSGEHYMEDFHAAGGMATLLRALKPLLHLDALTVTGRTLGEELEAQGPGFAQDVVRPLTNPIYPQGGIAVLYGNLAPGGAIIKQSAADAADGTRRPRRGVRGRGRPGRAHRRPGAGRHGRRRAGAQEHRAQGRTPACPRPATSRSRASWRGRA